MSINLAHTVVGTVQSVLYNSSEHWGIAPTAVTHYKWDNTATPEVL